jgi:hypothetical protein
MMKKQLLVALLLLLLIPVVTVGGGMLSNLINPELAAGHSNYGHNFQLLMSLKKLVFFGSFCLAVALYLLGCYLVIRSKKQSRLWLLLALLGPLGFAILSVLNDRAPLATDTYTRLLRKLNVFVRVGYELCSFVIIGQLAYQTMVLKRILMIRYESITTGISSAQILAIQNASSGMWAFAEGMEVMFFVVVLYLLRPIAFNLVAHVAATRPSPETN